jgi:hypothetical protein
MSWTTRLPSGRKLEQGANRPEDWLGTVEVLARATRKNVHAGKRFLPQGNPDDFANEQCSLHHGCGLGPRAQAPQPLCSCDFLETRASSDPHSASSPPESPSPDLRSIPPTRSGFHRGER